MLKSLPIPWTKQMYLKMVRPLHFDEWIPYKYRELYVTYGYTYFSDVCYLSKKLLDIAIRRSPHVYFYCDDKDKTLEHAQYVCNHVDIFNLGYIPVEHRTLAICEKALVCRPKNIKYVPEQFATKQFLINMMTKYNIYIPVKDVTDTELLYTCALHGAEIEIGSRYDTKGTHILRILMHPELFRYVPDKYIDRDFALWACKLFQYNMHFLPKRYKTMAFFDGLILNGYMKFEPYSDEPLSNLSLSCLIITNHYIHTRNYESTSSDPEENMREKRFIERLNSHNKNWYLINFFSIKTKYAIVREDSPYDIVIKLGKHKTENISMSRKAIKLNIV
jgi:hypothetical protein